MRHSTPMFLLALLTAVVPGCNCLNDLDRYSFEGDDDMGPTDQGPDTGEDDDLGTDGGPLTECTGLDAPLDYRIETLDIPITSDVLGDRALGHDVDGAGSACSVTDFVGDVDNSFMGLAEALPALNPALPVRFQADIDRGLSCLDNVPSCKAPRWTVRVERGTGCAQITILHGSTAAVLAGPFVASVDGSGNVRGEFDTLDFEIAHYVPGSPTDSIPFVIRDGIFSARMSELALSDIVIGGTLLQSELEATFALVAGDLSDGSIEYADIAALLTDRYDVSVGGSCERMSIGLRATAARCPGTSAPTVYRLTTIHIPTGVEANNGGTVGHDVDGVAMACSHQDFPNQVDNDFIDFAEDALPDFDANIDLQASIDASLGCAMTGASCVRQDIFVSVATGDECAVVAVAYAADSTQLASRVASLSGGELQVRLPFWYLAVPIVHNTATTYQSMRMEDVILTADVTPSALSNVVIGGLIPDIELAGFVRSLLDTYDNANTDFIVTEFLPNFHDMVYFDGCNALSIGVTATGTAVP
ncbi:MAG: hypothetical protein IPL19_20295 [Sandaracinaceae bacterium]|jgi:hypothetical protein|nr:hypothetical protein [Sandaracinaceae bacterium]MBK7777152.1 hypothetical protein [Sandaracinaceae bacterium]MBK8410300.1 hypothetical protein [Sandaracinaceae bacterium]MBK8591125.1 hypothetical protein [Sandaracinaceae bacterium]MBP7683846.1 hypothetical protein [Deltaproteobacteria bacterium]